MTKPINSEVMETPARSGDARFEVADLAATIRRLRTDIGQRIPTREELREPPPPTLFGVQLAEVSDLAPDEFRLVTPRGSARVRGLLTIDGARSALEGRDG